MDISIIGLGNVGKNVLRIIAKDNVHFFKRYGLKINIVSVSDSKHTVLSKGGIDPDKALEQKINGDISKIGCKTIDFEDIFELETDCIVDLSPATSDGVFGRDLYLRAFHSGKDVVTANKAPLALHWKRIMDEAQKNGKRIRYESTVAGGVPLFNLRDFSLRSSTVLGFRGVVSSTVNYVLKSMIKGVDFLDSIRNAQEMGIAEADYHDDTAGLDAARKTVILANSLFGKALTLNDIEFEGIENEKRIEPLKTEKGDYRLLSSISLHNDNLIVKSSIEKLEDNDPLLLLKETSLGYSMITDNNGEVFVAGLHDGPLETASGVVNDLLILGMMKQ